jgi:hypothetical protein
MGDNESDKEPLNEILKKKNKLIKMLKNKIFTDEDLSKIESSIKKLR